MCHPDRGAVTARTTILSSPGAKWSKNWCTKAIPETRRNTTGFRPPDLSRAAISTPQTLVPNRLRVATTAGSFAVLSGKFRSGGGTFSHFGAERINRFGELFLER